MAFLRKLFGKRQPAASSSSESHQRATVPKKNAEQWCEEGNSLASCGQYSEALACLEEALQIDPKHALTWFNMGLTLMNLGKKEEAIKAFTTFIKYAPPEAQALHVPTAKGYIRMLSTGEGITRIEL
jgi:tetratricopeptide (TPR) repeat protein